MKNETKIGLDTMLGVGKKKKIAGREYYILPVCIKDMIYVIGNGTENDETKTLVMVDRESLEKEEIKWQLFGLNIVDEERKKIFLKILNRYVYYCSGDEKIPMTEDLLVEHNWSFKEIGEFLLVWSQISD